MVAHSTYLNSDRNGTNAGPHSATGEGQISRANHTGLPELLETVVKKQTDLLSPSPIDIEKNEKKQTKTWFGDVFPQNNDEVGLAPVLEF